jgi:hypothetical protein
MTSVQNPRILTRTRTLQQPYKFVAIVPKKSYLIRLEELADKLLTSKCQTKYAGNQIYRDDCDIVALGMKAKVSLILTSNTYENIKKKLITYEDKKQFIKEGFNKLNKIYPKQSFLRPILGKILLKNDVTNESFENKLREILNNPDKVETIFRLLNILTKKSNNLQPIFLELILELCLNIISDDGKNILYNEIQYGGGFTRILEGISGVGLVVFGFLLCCTGFLSGPGSDVMEFGTVLLGFNPCKRISTSFGVRCK